LETASAAGSTGYRASHRGFTRRAQLYFKSAHAVTSGGAFVGLRAERRGLVAGSVIASFLIAVTLGVFWRDADAVSRSSSATSLLLLAPGLVAAYLARPGEHALA